METLVHLLLASLGSALIHAAGNVLARKLRRPVLAVVRSIFSAPSPPAIPEIPAPPMVHVAAHTLGPDLPPQH